MKSYVDCMINNKIAKAKEYQATTTQNKQVLIDQIQAKLGLHYSTKRTIKFLKEVLENK